MHNFIKFTLRSFSVLYICMFLYNESRSCSFPQIYVHHHAYPVKTEVDSGPSTWYNPIISGQYDGCGLGISDRHNFTLKAGDTHSVMIWKYYAVVGTSSRTCDNYAIYGKDSPLTKRYETICKEGGGKAPGICLVYEDKIISWAFSDCVNTMSFSTKLNNIDQQYPKDLPDIDQCIGIAGAFASGGCFPFPLPPSPPPFCTDAIPTPPQTPVYTAICNADYSNADVCAQPLSPALDTSTYFKPCARVTFSNNIPVNTATSGINARLLPICTSSNSDKFCITIASKDANAINENIPENIMKGQQGYVEAIYTENIGGVNGVTSQTYWNTNTQNPLKFYGYNLAEFQDLCYDFNADTAEQAHLTDNYGNERIFKTCKSADDPESSYCIEEALSNTASTTCSDENHPFCFSRPNFDKPTVTFCDDNNKTNSSTDYCLQTIFNGTTYKFTKDNRSQGLFSVMETNNNYNTPSASNLCVPYYDQNVSMYNKTGNSTGCTYFGGLFYKGATYQSGANKLCLLGYESTKQEDMVCNKLGTDQAQSGTTDADAPKLASKLITDRAVPDLKSISPLTDGDCCNPSAEISTKSNTCAPAPGNPFRARNPIEEGLCVDIMLFDFQDCNSFQATTDPNAKNPVTESEASESRNQCSTYQTFCKQTDAKNTSYVNADTCNKNYIDCSAGLAPGIGVQGVTSSNICKFYKN